MTKDKHPLDNAVIGGESNSDPLKVATTGKGMTIADAVDYIAGGPVTINPNLEFSDLSDEEYRVYEFPGGCAIRLNEPTHLHVSDSGGHRVLTADGVSHYIPKGWLHLSWVVKSGCPKFAF